MSAVEFALRCFERFVSSLVALAFEFECGFGILWCRRSCEDSILKESVEKIYEDVKLMLNIQRTDLKMTFRSILGSDKG
jgi:hypothetical protein